jgi:sensor histidine kinase YesM
MNSIQKKIWSLVLVALLIMAATWFSLIHYNQKMLDQYNNILERYLVLNEITIKSEDTVTALNNYLLIPSEDNFKAVTQNKKDIQKMKNEVATFKNVENELALTNYVNLIDSFLETVDLSLSFQSEAETEYSMTAFNEATHISNYISEMALTLIDLELQTYDVFYRDMISQSEELKQLGIWLLLLITVGLLLFTYWFSQRITKPVEKLTHAANELSKGRFDLKVEVNSSDEIAFLAKMFERMRVNINKLISEMHHQAQLENELQQSRLLLKESQLRNLQSQINPHFLFNTLNTLSKKAYMEGSEETSDLLVSVAGLLRYNLKHLDKPMTLYDEVYVMKQYIEIQKTRYTDRLTFQTEIDESCLHILIPGLTLQPLVENAVIYAVEPHEEGGTIWFRIIDEGDLVTIEVEDNGPGMSDEKIQEIYEEKVNTANGHSSGIGLSNVMKRLRLFNGMEDVMEIESSPGSGTKVSIKLLKERGSETHDQNTNSG